LLGLPWTITTLRRRDIIARKGERARNCCILLSGVAMRHKTTGNGDRQILSIQMPGDAIDLDNWLLGGADYNVEMLRGGEVARVPVEAVHQLTLSRPSLGQAMWCATIVDAAILREWTLNISRRDARSRTAHLLCELGLRLEAAGLGGPAEYELPMTHAELSDALALTPIHISRMLKVLEEEGLIERTKRLLTIRDWERLVSVGDFDPAYLHLASVRRP
jgi:CRP-like cAMP-binding protein